MQLSSLTMDNNEQILFSKTTYMLSPLRTFKSSMERTHTFYKYIHRNKPSHSLAQRITPLNHIYNPFELATSPSKLRMSSYSYKPIRKINTTSSFNRLSSSTSRHNLTYYDNYNNTDVINITMETPPCNNTKLRHSKTSTLSEGDNYNNNTNTNVKVRNSINVIEIIERENDSSKDDIYDAFDGEQLTIKKTITKKEENKMLEEYKRRVLDENNELTRGGKVNLNEEHTNDNEDRGLFKGDSIRKGIALNMDIVNQLLSRGDVKGNKDCGVWDKIEEESSQRDCESYNTPRSDRKERGSRNVKRCDELSEMKKITEEKNVNCEDGEELGNESKGRNENESAGGKKGNLKEESGSEKDKEELKMRKVRFKMKNDNVNDDVLMDEEQHELQDDNNNNNIIEEGLLKEECENETEDNIQNNINISNNDNKDNNYNDEIKTHIEKQKDIINDNNNNEIDNNKTEVINVNENNEEKETEIINKEINIKQEINTCDNQNENVKLNNDNNDINKPNKQINESQNKAKQNNDQTTEEIVFPNKDNENDNQQLISYNDETNKKEFPDSLNEDIKLQHEYNEYMETIHEKNENIVDENEIQQHEDLNTKSDIESYIELTKELNKRLHNNNDNNINNKHFSNETSLTKHNENILPIQHISPHKEQHKANIENNENVFTKEENNINNNNQLNLSQTNTNEHNNMKSELEYEHMLINESSHGNNQQFNIENGINVNNEILKDINVHQINKSHLPSHTETELHNMIHDDNDDEHCDIKHEDECKDKLIFKHKNINKQQQLNNLSRNERNDLQSNEHYYENEPHIDNDEAVLNNFKQTITEENERIPTNATIEIKKTILTSLDENNNNEQEGQLLITPRKNFSPKPKNDTIQTPSKPLTELNNHNTYPLIYKKQNSFPIKTNTRIKDKDDLIKDIRMYNTDRDHYIQEEILLDEKERNKFVFATPGKQPNLEIKKLNIPPNNNNTTNHNNNNNNSSSRFPSPRNESVLIESIATPKKQPQIIYKRSPINKDTLKHKFTSEHEINISPNKNHKPEITIKDEFNINNNCLLKKHSPKQSNTIPSSIIIPLCNNKELNSNIPKQLLLKQMKKDKEINNIMLNSNEKIIKLNKYNSQTITNNNNIDNTHQFIKTHQHDLSISKIQPINIISKYRTQQHSPERVHYLNSNINSPYDIDNNTNNNDITSNHFIPVSKKYSFIKQSNTITTTNDNTSSRHCYTKFNNNNKMHSHSQLDTLLMNNNAQSTIDYADKFTINGTHTLMKCKQGKLYSRNNKNRNTNNRFIYKDILLNTNSKATQTETPSFNEMKYVKTNHTNTTRLKKYKTLTVNNNNDNDKDLSRNNLSFYKCSQTHRGGLPMTCAKDNDIQTSYISHTSLISQRSLDNDYSYSYDYTEKPFYTIQQESKIKEEYTDKECVRKKGNGSKYRKGNTLKKGKDEVSKYKYQITINEEDCIFD